MIIPEELYCFAYCYDFQEELRKLQDMVIPEPWRFLNPQMETVNQETPILERYIRNVFRHQAICANRYGDSEERGRFLFIRGMLACMHTGLVTPYLEGVYALFEANRKIGGRCNWVFVGFYPASSSKLRCIPRLPLPPRFYTESDGFHPEWEIRINYAHILQDARNASRLPEELHGMKNLPLLLHAAVLYGRTLTSMNPSNAAAQVYCGRIQYLLPVCMTDLGKCDLALTLTPQNGFYLGHTCLTLEMAYHNARMLCRPTASWLQALVDKQAAQYVFPYERIYGM